MCELKYPKKSHRKTITIPEESADLAEFLGIEMGDGGINNGWQVVISLNSISDREYAIYIQTIFYKLFNILVKQSKINDENTIRITASSTNLVEFLLKKGAVKGNKIAQNINIPNWIFGNPEYEKSFVRGLVDTDGCLYIHKHTINGKQYKNIGFCFTSLSKSLIISVADILKKFDIKAYITDSGRRIYMYSYKMVAKYLQIFGTSNPRISNVYTLWRDRIVAECATLERW